MIHIHFGQKPDSIHTENLWEYLDPAKAVLDFKQPTQEKNPWTDIELTGMHFKMLADSKKKDGKFPVWIPVTAGIVGAGAASYFLFFEKDDDDGITARMDQFTFPCGMNISFNVLANDSGDGLTLVTLSNTGILNIAIGGNGLLTLEGAPAGTYEFNYTISDAAGKTATGTVRLIIEDLPLIAMNDSYSTVSGSSVSGNLLDNDSGSGMRITDHSAPGSGTLELSQDGNFTYTPGSSTDTLVTFTYTLEDDCGKTANATVSIHIQLPPCSLEAEFNIQPATCGLEDGTVHIDILTTGNFIYNWSNGAVGATIFDLPGGAYSVTVTDQDQDCQQKFEVDVPTEAVDYLLDSEVFSGTCVKEGNIVLELQSPIGGAFVITGTGPEGEFNFTSPDASVNFQEHINALPGKYTFTIYAVNLGSGCTEDFSFNIPDDSPDINAVNDFYNTSNTNTLSGNVLGNDSGLEIQITGNTQPGSGILDLKSDGSFTYIPEEGFTGTVTFTYTITDTCGNSTEGMVEITVTGEDCSFNVVIELQHPDCNFSNGILSAHPFPPGSYTFLWSNGQTTDQIENLGPGTYSLTVTSLDQSCEKVFSETLVEQQSEYILALSSSTATCEGGGNITLTLSNPGQGLLTIQLISEEVQEEFLVNPGVVQLGTFINIVPGTYTIIVFDPDAGIGCAQTEIIEVADNSPSPQAANDSFEINSGATLEANILLNDQGQDLEVISFGLPSSGTLNLDPDGSMKYEPAAGFEGAVEFEYVIANNCGNTDTALVHIQIIASPCSFTTNFIRQLPHCGFNDGSIIANVSPIGNYTFLWSTGANSMSIGGLAAGTYFVTITDTQENCSLSFTLELQSLPASYMTIEEVIPGHCLGEGDIVFNLETLGIGPLHIHVFSSGISENLTLGEGMHNMNAFFNVPSGTYEISVFDQSIGLGCTQMLTVEVPDTTPDLAAADDAFSTPFETELSENVLENDVGFGLSVIQYFNVENGTLIDMQPDGSFSFLPDVGFMGIAGFNYTVTDSCGSTVTADVIIVVEEETCNFTLITNISAASCGQDDGSAQVLASEPGFYFYEWSTGSTGSFQDDLSAGVYTVTVTDLELICFLVFEVEIPEDPAMYVSNVNVIQPNCNQEANIFLTLTSPAGGPFSVQVEHPNGIENFIAPVGQNNLSDHLPIAEGNYLILVIDQNIGDSCVDTVMVTVDPLEELSIGLSSVTPPSSETSEDGVITVQIINATEGPYTIILNGEEIGQTTEFSFSIENLGEGEYTIQFMDANGCLSNILEVSLFATEPPLEFGMIMGGGTLPLSAERKEVEMPEWIKEDNVAFLFGQSLYLSFIPSQGFTKLQLRLTASKASLTGESGKIGYLGFQSAILTSWVHEFRPLALGVATGPVSQLSHYRYAKAGESLSLRQTSWIIEADATLDLFKKAEIRLRGSIFLTEIRDFSASIECRLPLSR